MKEWRRENGKAKARIESNDGEFVEDRVPECDNIIFACTREQGKNIYFQHYIEHAEFVTLNAFNIFVYRT